MYSGINLDEKVDYFPDNADCPVRDVISQLTSKWAMLVLFALIGEELRFNELEKRIENISRKMLTTTLRQLQRDGYIAREAFAEVPPRVEYTITPMGYEVVKLLTELTIWTKENHAHIRDSRALYDAKSKP